MYGHYFCPRCVCVSYVEKINMIRASGITGVASHGKHTRATGNKIEQNFPLVKFGPQNCPASGYGNFVGPKFS